jgi:hypothetical protein
VDLPSWINAIIREADDFIRAHGFHLPPFAHWTPDEWKTKGPEVREIVDRKLGWDVTDFNLGEYRQTGLLLFTIRNGDVNDPQSKQYAEKVMSGFIPLAVCTACAGPFLARWLVHAQFLRSLLRQRHHPPVRLSVYRGQAGDCCLNPQRCNPPPVLPLFLVRSPSIGDRPGYPPPSPTQ